MADLTETSGATYPAARQIENGEAQAGGENGLWNEHAKVMVERTNNLKGRVDALNLKAATLVTVGAGGQFATINAALTYLSDRRPAYVSGGFETELRLKAGFIMREQVLVKSVNLAWIKITSEDAEVQIDRAYLTVASSAGFYAAFAAEDGGYTPTIATLFSMMATGASANRCGIRLYNGGGANVAEGKGIKGAPIGVQMNAGATLIAYNAVFTGSLQYACVVHGGAVAVLQGADLRNGGGVGIYAANAARVHAASAIITGCAGGAIIAGQGAHVTANTASCRTGASDASTDMVVGGGSIITAAGSTGGTSIAINTLTSAGVIFK